MSNVADVKPKKRTVDLGDGVEREVTLSLNAMAELEDKYGSIESAFDKVKSGSVAAIRFLLWCILSVDEDEDRALTEREVGKFIRIDNLNDIMDTLTEIMAEQMPEADDSPNQQTPAEVIPLPNSTW